MCLKLDRDIVSSGGHLQPVAKWMRLNRTSAFDEACATFLLQKRNSAHVPVQQLLLLHNTAIVQASCTAGVLPEQHRQNDDLGTMHCLSQM